MSSRIPESVIDEVSSRVSIADVVGEHVRLKRKGNRLWGLCPFHNEKSASFSVNESRNLYHCFGCGASGNAYGFLMRNQGLNFPEAVRLLAEKVGVEIPDSTEDSASAARRRAERELYFEATDLAVRYYRAVLKSGKFSEPLEYLKTRGIDDETAERFDLGFAPPEWSALVDALGRRGVNSKTLEMAGLANGRRQGDGHVDRFRNRVMFPIVSLAMRTLAFSGRTLDAEERAKYVNSPETPFYTKGKELYGLHVAHKNIRAEGAAVLVEGNFDVVSLHAKGLGHVCAPLGTALTEHQARLIKRYSDRVVLLFDADDAGRNAARKALGTLLTADVQQVLLAELPDGQDPDDFVHREGPDALRKLIDKARPMLDVEMDAAIRPAAGRGDASAKRAAARSIGDLLQNVSSKLVRDTYITEAARRLEVEEAVLREELRASGSPKRRAAAQAPEASPEPVEASNDGGSFDVPEEEVAPLSQHEEVLVEALAEKPELLEVVYREQIHLVIGNQHFSDFLERASVNWTEEGTPPFAEAVEACENIALKRNLQAALVADHGLTPEDCETAFEDAVKALKVNWIHAEMRRISESQRSADYDEMLELAKRHAELTEYLRRFRGAAPL
ncbi:MAG: DNA primase [Bradymonadia bacterium]